MQAKSCAIFRRDIVWFLIRVWHLHSSLFAWFLSVHSFAISLLPTWAAYGSPFCMLETSEVLIQNHRISWFSVPEELESEDSAGARTAAAATRKAYSSPKEKTEQLGQPNDAFGPPILVDESSVHGNELKLQWTTCAKFQSGAGYR